MTLTAMGRDLRARRRALGLTQAALAEAVGSRPVIVGRWERGEALPTLDEVVRLAEVLDLDPAVAAGWSAVARRSAPEPARVAVATAVPAPPPEPAEQRRWTRPAWLARFAGVATPLRKETDSEAGGEDGAVFPTPGPRLPGESYLDDPEEQRRYALRWALTLLALATLAVGLVWALGELRAGWGALLDLFRGHPPGSGLTRALPWMGVG